VSKFLFQWHVAGYEQRNKYSLQIQTIYNTDNNNKIKARFGDYR